MRIFWSFGFALALIGNLFFSALEAVEVSSIAGANAEPACRCATDCCVSEADTSPVASLPLALVSVGVGLECLQMVPRNSVGDVTPAVSSVDCRGQVGDEDFYPQQIPLFVSYCVFLL